MLLLGRCYNAGCVCKMPLSPPYCACHGKLTSLLRLRKSEVDEDMEVAIYPIDVAYHTLVSHCESEHEVALDVLASMTPSKIAEMHQHLHAAQ
jgi:hypothetical protein